MAEIIHTPLTVVHVMACVFLILVILIQPGKSGGLGIFGSAGAQQVFGGRGAGNFLTKTTWTTAAIFFVTSISLAYLSSSTDEALQKRSESSSQSKEPGKTPAPATSK
ncbi:MAG TPA: preprotein translocase subunit SecG [Polyangiaceae bacterium]|jgi:preprotein translocase subunit SecG|nr:preprotein translocase subunit SecG [Polyangiaceae bacterium]